jgi:hypothetical protein
MASGVTPGQSRACPQNEAYGAQILKPILLAAKPACTRPQSRESKLTPSVCALNAVAPIVRFNALDIFVTPTFLRASDFNSRISVAVHARLTNFLAISFPRFFWNRRLTHIA